MVSEKDSKIVIPPSINKERNEDDNPTIRSDRLQRKPMADNAEFFSPFRMWSMDRKDRENLEITQA